MAYPHISNLMQGDRHVARIFKNAQKESNKQSTDYIDSSYSGPVQSVNLMAQENSKLHHTAWFHNVNNNMKTPIFRRGQHFSFIINFKKPFKLANNLQLDLSTGSPKEKEKEILIRLPVSNNPEFQPGKDWAVRLISQTEQSLKLEIKIPPNSPIGVWTMVVVTGQENTPYYVPKYFYILFNPWSKDDSVYIADERQRTEYVMNQSGIVYTGSHPYVIDLPWHYNQFFPVTLPAAIVALEISRKTFGKVAYNNPVEVSRALTYSGGTYLLEGRWTLEYPEDTNPSQWIDTTAILERFMNTFNPTQFGQCWVFAAMTCSLGRALGIPCRVITNFGSAHDHNGDLIIDIPRTETNHDSNWNFHVWNEGWMTRPDLPAGYGGWQAFDATPQEQSRVAKHKVFVCGPASVTALKKGEVNHPYDAMFIFAESVCDQRINVWNKFTEQYVPVKYAMDRFGEKLLTKAVDANAPEDVTSKYRFGRVSTELRESMATACKHAKTPMPVPIKIKEEDIFCDLLPLESVEIGHSIQLIVKIENRSQKSHVVDVAVGCVSMVYNGEDSKNVDLSGGTSRDKLYHRTFNLVPEQSEILQTEVTADMYQDYAIKSKYFKINATMTVQDSRQAWYGEDYFSVIKPKLTLEMPSDLQVGRPFTLRIKFTNPLRMELRYCQFKIGSTCTERPIVSHFRDIRPLEEVRHEVQLTPEFRGPCAFTALFDSYGLTEVIGSKQANCS